MQELFAAKVHFLKFFSVSDKPWLDKLKIITAARLTSFSEFFHRYSEGKIPSKKEKYPVLRTNSKPQQLIKRTKISSFIASFVLCKPFRGTYRNGLNRGTTSRTSKSTNRSSLKPFVRNPNLSILVRRVRCCLRKDRFFREQKFDVKELKMNKFIKSIWELNTTPEVPLLHSCKQLW